jgi:hypothetical protein
MSTADVTNRPGGVKLRWIASQERLLPIVFLMLGMGFVVLPQTHFASAIPGDLGDARFNGIILEHVYRWFSGLEESLWSPRFFYPYTGALSFSDAHFGTVAIYALQRWLGLDPDTAYIGWYLAGFILNYAACYYVARQLGLRPLASAMAAFVFSFAMPVVAQSGHAQLGYRFAVPLAMFALHRVLSGSLADLANLAIWATVQFYCSIYIGYFLLLLMFAYAIAFIGGRIFLDRRPFQAAFDLAARGRDFLWRPALIVAVCLIATGALFAPYAYYSSQYGFGRGAAEIQAMLPRLASYLLADGSSWWQTLSSKLDGVPVRHEQQLFVGIFAILLATMGALNGASRFARICTLSIAILVLLTLSWRGISLYMFVQQLPMASAVRAVSRIILVILFPIALLVGLGIDRLVSIKKRRALFASFAAFLVAGVIAESATIRQASVPLAEWRAYEIERMAHLPGEVPRDAILFVPSAPDVARYMTELDGMAIAQRLGVSTINGYSGNAPVGFGLIDEPCQDLINRLVGHAQSARINRELLRELMSKVLFVGRDVNCELPDTLPVRSRHFGALAMRQYRDMSIELPNLEITDSKQLVQDVVVRNASDKPLPSLSASGNPIFLSWRMVRLEAPVPGALDWTPRIELVEDVPANGILQQREFISAPSQSGRYRVQWTLVQEGIRWFHNAGMSIAQSDALIVVGDDGVVTLDAL